MFLLIVPSPVKLQNSLYNHWHPFIPYKVGTLLITEWLHAFQEESCTIRIVKFWEENLPCYCVYMLWNKGWIVDTFWNVLKITEYRLQVFWSIFLSCMTLKKKALKSSEMLGTSPATQHHVRENLHLQQHCHKHLISHNSDFVQTSHFSDCVHLMLYTNP